jgi:transcriptional regulator with XRE-family HTH domain
MNTSNVTTIIKNELSQIMKERGLTIAQLAETAGVGVATVHKILQKDPNINITLQVLDKIATALDTPIETLLSKNKSNLSTSTVKLITWDKILDRNKVDIEDCKLINTHCQLSDSAFAVRMSGKSMEPLFPNGTILIIEPETNIYDGCFAMIEVNDKVIFKQIVIDPPEIFYTSLRNGLDALKPISKKMIIGTLVESTIVHEKEF